MLNDSLKSAPPQHADELKALQAFGRILDLLSDPQETKQRVAALTAAATQSSALLEKIKADSDALDKKRAEHLDLMTQERAEHDALLKSSRLAFENEAAAMRNKLTEAQNAATAAQAEAKAARERSVVLNADLESRLSMIHGAATAPLPAQQRQ